MTSKEELNKLYQEILSRDIDDDGYEEYKFKSLEVVKYILLHSHERKSNIRGIIKEIYTEITRRDCDNKMVEMILRMNKNITTSQLRFYYNVYNEEDEEEEQPPIKLLDQWIVPYWISKHDIKKMLIIMIENFCFTLNKNCMVDVLKKNLLIKENEFRLFPHNEKYNDNDITNPWNIRDPEIFKYEIYHFFIVALWKNYHCISAPTDGTQEITIRLRELYVSKDMNWESLTNHMYKYIIDLIYVRICGMIPKYKMNYDFKNPSLIVDDALKMRSTFIKPLLQEKKSVVVMIPYLEDMHASFIHTMKQKVNEMVEKCKNIEFTINYDNERMKKEDADYTPWSRVKRIRNKMVQETDMTKFDYVLWIDADMVEYPSDFPARAISINPEGITAPLALIEKTTTFYDWCGYVPKGKSHIDEEKIGYIYGRQIGLIPPYLPKHVEEKRTFIQDLLNDKIKDDNPIVEMDCVGCMYLMPAKTFQMQYKKSTKEHLRKILEKFNVKHHLDEKKVWYEDHPSFTDHYSICSVIRDNGHKVIMDKCSAAYHADLPKYKCGWH